MLKLTGLQDRRPVYVNPHNVGAILVAVTGPEGTIGKAAGSIILVLGAQVAVMEAPDEVAEAVARAITPVVTIESSPFPRAN